MKQSSNIEAERGLIGCLLDHRDGALTAFYCTKRGVNVDSFNDADCAQIFSTQAEMRTQGRAVSRTTLFARLASKGVDAEQALALIHADHTAHAFAAAFVENVRAAQIIRDAAASAELIGRMVRDGETPDSIIATFQAESLKLCGIQAMDVRTLATERGPKIEQWHAAREKGFVGVPSCFRQLNAEMGGYRPSVMTVLGAYRGTGKSTLARQEAAHKAHEMRMPTALISLEDPADVAAAGIAGALRDFSVYHLDIGESRDEVADVDARWKSVEDAPLYIVGRGMNIGEIVNTLTGLRAAKQIQFAIVDHIQFIRPSKRHGSRNDEVAHYSAELSALAKHLEIPILVCSQLSRECEKEGRTPRLSDLRDSGAIEQDARQVLLLYRDPAAARDVNTEFELCVAKNNFGRAGGKLRLIREDGRQRFRVNV